MAMNLIDIVKGYLTPEVVDRAAAYVGESSPDTYRAMTAIVPTLVGALASTASTSGGAQQIARMLDAGTYDGSLLGSLGSVFGGGVTTQNTIGAGKCLMESLFGGKLASVIDLISRSTGVRPGSASLLMALVAPILMHILGRQRAAAGGGVAGLATLLGDQRSFLGGVLPAGMASLLGWSGAGISEVGSSATGAVSRAGDLASASARRPGWLVPVAAVAALVLLWFGYLLWGAPPVRDVAREATRTLAELQLPGGLKISVPEGAFAFSLASWLASTSDTAVLKRFVFDHLNFRADRRRSPRSRSRRWTRWSRS
jgi:OmpA-OmpF porin, OOP family